MTYIEEIAESVPRAPGSAAAETGTPRSPAPRVVVRQRVLRIHRPRLRTGRVAVAQAPRVGSLTATSIPRLLRFGEED